MAHPSAPPLRGAPDEILLRGRDGPGAAPRRAGLISEWDLAPLALRPPTLTIPPILISSLYTEEATGPPSPGALPLNLSATTELPQAGLQVPKGPALLQLPPPHPCPSSTKAPQNLPSLQQTSGAIKPPRPKTRAKASRPKTVVAPLPPAKVCPGELLVHREPPRQIWVHPLH